MKEKHKFILLVLGFLFIYFLPVKSIVLPETLLGPVELLNEYVRLHFLTCLIPAFFIAGAIAVFLKKEFLLRYLGSDAKKYIAYPVASIAGTFLAVCSCTILPLFAGIYKRGAGIGPAVAFLFSGPAINIAAIFLTFSVLQQRVPHIAEARVFFSISMAILIGLFMSFLFKEKPGKGELIIEEKKASVSNTSLSLFFLLQVSILVINGLQIENLLKYGLMLLAVISIAILVLEKFKREQISEWFGETWSFTKLLLPYLFFGIIIAGFIEPLVPRSFIENFVGSNTLFSNLIASVFGAFMYFCTLSEVPIIEAFVEKGMASGPALALLLAGPSLSLPNMLVIGKVLGTKKTIAYITLVVIFSTIAGLIFGSI
jgi:uncharacterized membrane protein YraQ (UPF0718 family)